MILKLNNKEKEVSESIYRVFQASYKVEAKILNADDFPPLKRTVQDFIDSNTEFFGYFQDTVLAAIVEINNQIQFIHIQSFVVSPSHFRKGIGSKLMEFSLQNYDSTRFKVETGVENIPAINLYKKFGFKETKQWNTSSGIRKIELKFNR